MVNSDITTKKLLGIGVTINGIVDPFGGISVNSFGRIPDNTNIREQIEQRLHLPVSVNNNVRSMLMAESAINHHNQDISHLFIKYGPGLGAAFSIGQQTYNGAQYRALELGHVVMKPDGELCRCGRRGCLETLLSYKTVFREAQELANEETTPVLCRRMKRGGVDLKALSDSVSGGDGPVHDFLRGKFTLFARCLEGYATIFDPQTISVCSEMLQYQPLQALFSECIHRDAVSAESRLILNPDSDKTEQVGAAALVVHSFLEGRLF